MNVKKAFKEQVDPEENWLMFSLIKVKLKDSKLLVVMYLAHLQNFGISLCFELADVLFFKVYQDDGHY